MRFREMDKILKEDGWYEVSQRGSHHQYKHPTKPGKVYSTGTRREGHKPYSSKENIKTGGAVKPQCLKDERKRCAYEISLSSSIYSI